MYIHIIIQLLICTAVIFTTGYGPRAKLLYVNNSIADYKCSFVSSFALSFLPAFLLSFLTSSVPSFLASFLHFFVRLSFFLHFFLYSFIRCFVPSIDSSLPPLFRRPFSFFLPSFIRSSFRFF